MREKTKILYQLLNYRRNEELLRRIPHVPYLDLAIVFVQEEKAGQTRRLITQGGNPGELEKQAAFDTPRCCPVYFHPLDEVIRELGCELDQEFPQESCGLPMYLLTNVQKFLGASVILYPGLLHKIGEWLEDDFYILPSSIHECILVPARTACSKRLLEEMVAEVNRAQVPESERLSDSVYYYQTKEDSICF